MCKLLQLCVWQVVADDVRNSITIVVGLKAATMQRLQDKPRVTQHQLNGIDACISGSALLCPNHNLGI
jgi:hypothetical protein